MLEQKSNKEIAQPTPYTEMLAEICQEEGIELRWFSDAWLASLKKGQRVRQILGYKFDLNPAAASAIAEDKSQTYELLQAAHIPAVPHQVFYEQTNQSPYVHGRNSLAYLAKYFDEHQHDIVLKPNDAFASGGLNVFRLTDLTQAPEYLARVFHQSFSASLSPFLALQAEYRLVMLDGEVRLSYRKEATGDWRFNLQNGARPHDIADAALLARLTDLAKQTVATLGLRFCSVDIVQPRQAVGGDDLLVLEVNSGVMILNYLTFFPERRPLVKKIYCDAIRRMFTD